MGLTGIFDFAGTLLDINRSQTGQKRDARLQKEFAQKGIQWKAADAKAAGLHPLAAIGAPTTSFSPVSVGGDNSYSRAGQSIGRSLSKMLSKKEKVVEKIEIDSAIEKLKNMRLQNVGLQTEIDQMRRNPPVQSVTGGGDDFQRATGLVETKKVQIPAIKSVGVQAGVKPFHSDRIDDQGNVWRMPSQETAEILESSFPDWARHMVQSGKNIAKSWWAASNAGYRRSFERQMAKVRPRAPLGFTYVYNLRRAQWRLKRVSGRRRSRDYVLEF